MAPFHLLRTLLFVRLTGKGRASDTFTTLGNHPAHPLLTDFQVFHNDPWHIFTIGAQTLTRRTFIAPEHRAETRHSLSAGLFVVVPGSRWHSGFLSRHRFQRS